MVATKKGGVRNVSADGAVAKTDFAPPRRGSGNKLKQKDQPLSPIKLLVSDADTDYPCKICDKIVSDEPNSTAVQCDRCLAWIHLGCSRLRRLDYNYLTNNPQSTVKWYCEPCTKDIESGPDGQDSRILQHGVKIDTLLQVIKGMQVQMTAMQEQMAMMMETTNQKNDEVEAEKTVDSHSMHAKVYTEVMEEQREKEEKKNNIIMYNMPEPVTNDVNQAIKEDITLVKEVLAEVHPNIGEVEIDEKNTKRLGKEKKSGHTRPIKIQFRDDASKGQVFRNSAKLRSHDRFAKVNISSDKTRKELQEDRKLKEDLMVQRALRPDEDLIIHRGQIIKRANKPVAKVQFGPQANA